MTNPIVKTLYSINIMASQVFNFEEHKVQYWLNRPQKEFNFMTPLDMVFKNRGQEVLDYLKKRLDDRDKAIYKQLN
jgi:uncharacterized protein (DUF2384 family)